MAISAWSLNGHDICLTHGYWSGAASITVDDDLVFERPGEFFDYGFAHRFAIEGTPVAVRVVTNGVTFRHEMLSGFDAEQVEEADSQPVEHPIWGIILRRQPGKGLGMRRFLWYTFRMIWFPPSVACIFMFTWLAFNRAPQDGLAAVFFALVAYLTRPDWLRRKHAANSPAPTPDRPFESN
jgi:hypothetical protein